MDKPQGPTSHDIVDVARRALGVRRIGHTGTLDPFASGLLLLCVGNATRLAEYLSALDKTYEAVAVLGTRTDTLDRLGAVVEENEAWVGLSLETIRHALARLEGEIDQVPPQYSAKKVGGVAMHRRARRGERVELAPARVVVHRIEVTELAPPRVSFRVRCSSGTYVRCIARDFGDALSTGAHLARLRRTSIGRVDVGAAIEADRLSDAAAVREASIDPLAAVSHLPTVTVGGQEAARLSHGQQLRRDDAPTGLVAVENGGRLLAVADVADGVLSPRKVFAS